MLLHHVPQPRQRADRVVRGIHMRGEHNAAGGGGIRTESIPSCDGRVPRKLHLTVGFHTVSGHGHRRRRSRCAACWARRGLLRRQRLHDGEICTRGVGAAVLEGGGCGGRGRGRGLDSPGIHGVHATRHARHAASAVPMRMAIAVSVPGRALAACLVASALRLLLPASDGDRGSGRDRDGQCSSACHGQERGGRVALSQVSGCAAMVPRRGSSGNPSNRPHGEGQVLIRSTPPRVDDRQHAVLDRYVCRAEHGFGCPASATAADTVLTGRSSVDSFGLARSSMTGAPPARMSTGRRGDVAHGEVSRPALLPCCSYSFSDGLPLASKPPPCSSSGGEGERGRAQHRRTGIGGIRGGQRHLVVTGRKAQRTVRSPGWKSSSASAPFTYTSTGVPGMPRSTEKPRVVGGGRRRGCGEGVESGGHASRVGSCL